MGVAGDSADRALPTREQIESLIRQVNEAENRRPESTVEKTIAGVDAVMATDVEGWANGRHVPSRAVERSVERALFGLIPDYHRDIERVIVDPPYACFTWTMTGTVGRSKLRYTGCSVVEVNADGKAHRYWYYNDTAQFPLLVRLRFMARVASEELRRRRPRRGSEQRGEI